MKFTLPAYNRFISWSEANQEMIENNETHSSLQAHFMKYNALVPKIACIFHVADCLANDVGNEIPLEVCERAIEYVEYLRTHAYRIYGLGLQPDMVNAKVILDRMNKLPDQFTVRDVRRKSWIGLSSNKTIEEALSTLIEYGHIRKIEEHNQIGRPTIFFHKHPNYQLPKPPKVPAENSHE